MHIKNLTNSPYSLLTRDGQKVMLAARGEIDIDPHPMHASYYRQAGYFKTTESAKAAPKNQEPDAIETLRSEYEELSGKPADGRWSAKKIRAEIDALLES